MAKVKLGLDENILDLVSIGNVSRITRRPVKVYARQFIPGRHVLLQALGSAETFYTIEGLIDQDVDSNITKLLNLYHSQKPVILETDSFTVAGKITDLEIPYEAGLNFRRYRIRLAEIPFWGATIINEGEKAYLADLDFQLKAKQIYPMQARHNFQLDRINKKFSWEFILVNELEETSSFNALWDDDQTSFWNTGGGGTGSIGIPTISNDTCILKRGNNALKIQIGSGDKGYASLFHSYASPQDWSSYDFLAFWFYGDGSGNKVRFWISTDWGGAIGSYWDFNVDWTGWKRIVIPLRNPDGDDVNGRVDLANITRITFFFYDAATYYLDRGGIDVGNWVKAEIHVPDELQYDGEKGGKISAMFYSWDGSTFQKFADYDAEAWESIYWDGLYFLDGSNRDNLYVSSDGYGSWKWGNRGETANRLQGAKASSEITYSQTYGCLKRISFGIKMPPWTGSNDLTGKFAVNKAKLKIEVYYEKEETSYID